MRRVVAVLALAGHGVVATTARAEAPPELPRLVLDTGRAEAPAPEAGVYRFFIHGEDQIRYEALRSFPLVASASAMAARPGLVEQSLGQNQFVAHWLRLTPRLQLGGALEIVGQIEVTGLVVGDKARDTSADATPRDALNAFSNIQPRWLYAQYKLPFGFVRLGQQPNHWGMGIFANDGDHPVLFGDYRYGQISERLLFATQPAGRNSDFYLALAGDLVYRDNFARLTDGDLAVQGVLAAFYRRSFDTLGVYTALRHQESDRDRVIAEMNTLAVDVHGKVVTSVPSEPDAFFFGEAEATYLYGSTDEARTATQALAGAETSIRAYGGAVAGGFVRRRWATGFWRDAADAASARRTSAAYLGVPSERGVPYGDVVAQVEVGYASGDADPFDGTQKRFTFDPNHRIGLLLFDEILRFQTARAATAAADPLLTNPGRGVPASSLGPSNGAVFGAQYINPTAIVRPRHWLDLKAGAVIAQATSDVVDPYRLATSGSYVNYRGGDPKRHDLGIELDGGAEARIPLAAAVKAQVGAQAGVLFPGGAFDDASGVGLPVQWVAIGRLGLQF